MDCSIFCSASEYQLSALFDSLHAHYKTTHYRDVLHIEVPQGEITADLFYFTYGVTVCFGMDVDEGIAFVKKAQPFEVKSLDQIETDKVTYEYGKKGQFTDNHLVLPNDEILTKLAVAHGLSQTVKLEAFENMLLRTFEETKHIPEQLAKRGKIPLSRKAIRCMMGQLFIQRNSINLHVNVLDTPEFFWDHADLEPLYAQVAYELDLEDRVEVLNQRLKNVEELFEMLGNEVNHQHSSLLEWAIIWLIVIEVVLAFSKDVFHIL